MMVLGNFFKKLLIGRAFSADEGRIKLFGRMYWTLYPSRSLARNLQTIGEKEGKEYLYKLGYEAGQDASQELVESMGLLPRGGWITQNAIIELLEFVGFGRPEFLIDKIEKNGKHHLLLHVTDNPVIEHAVKLFKSKSVVCYWFLGVYTANAETELGIRHGHFKESKCLTKGAPYCEWESKWV